MKNTILLLLLLTCGPLLFSQIASFKKYEGRTLYVVLEKDTTSDISRTLRKAMNASWTLSKFEFITPAEFNTQHKDRDTTSPFLAVEDFSFGIVRSDTVVDCKALHFFYYRQDGDHVKPETFVTIPQGFEYSKTMYTVAGTKKTPIAAHGHGLNYYETIFLLHYYEASVKPVHGFTIENAGYDKASLALIRSKTLLLTSDMIEEGLSMKAIQSVYHHPVQIVSQDQIDRAIADKNPNIIYGIHGAMKMTIPGMQPTGSTNFFLVDAESGEVVYYHYADQLFLSKPHFKLFGKE